MKIEYSLCLPGVYISCIGRQSHVIATFVTIAILSGTDPIAVAGLLKSAGAPQRLTVSIIL